MHKVKHRMPIALGLLTRPVRKTDPYIHDKRRVVPRIWIEQQVPRTCLALTSGAALHLSYIFRGFSS